MGYKKAVEEVATFQQTLHISDRQLCEFQSEVIVVDQNFNFAPIDFSQTGVFIHQFRYFGRKFSEKKITTVQNLWALPRRWPRRHCSVGQ